MKANRKFLNRGHDDAVSPVIAVILMVAITVVLAATVYVWVSGFSTGDSAQRTIALASAGAETTSTFIKTYTVASASPGLKYSEIDITLDGSAYTFSTNPTASINATEWNVVRSSNQVSSTGLVTAGDSINLKGSATQVGDTVRVIDTSSNSVISTLVVNS